MMIFRPNSVHHRPTVLIILTVTGSYTSTVETMDGDALDGGRHAGGGQGLYIVPYVERTVLSIAA